MIKAVVFGSERNAELFARSRGLNPALEVCLSTQPESLYGFTGEHILVVRYGEKVWVPATFACERRTKQTSDILDELRSAGTDVEEVKL